jgi:hypothetical protein
VRKYLLRIGLSVTTFLLGLGLTEAPHRVGALPACRQQSVSSVDTGQPNPEPSSSAQSSECEVWIGGILTNQKRLSYAGYTIERRNKIARIDYPAEMGSGWSTVDVSYARVKRHGRAVATFDASLDSTMGVDTSFGLFPLLGGSKKQLIVSQDVSRGGTQWIASLSPRFHAIFDGPQWGVGREGNDMQIMDLDHDGVYEITVPITDFYDFQDNMSMSQIPLPEIIFKYERKSARYLPANHLFLEYALRNVAAQERAESSDESAARSPVLKVLLDYIYAGEEERGWLYFNRQYKLSDKDEIERRVKSILHAEPVYKFIYQHANARTE